MLTYSFQNLVGITSYGRIVIGFQLICCTATSILIAGTASDCGREPQTTFQKLTPKAMTRKKSRFKFTIKEIFGNPVESVEY